MPLFRKNDGSFVSYVKDLSNTDLAQRLYDIERKNDALVERREKSVNKEIERIFKRTIDQLEARINSYYLRYANKEGISVEEAKKRASAFDIREYEERAAKAVAERDFSEETNRWLRLYNLKMRASREELVLAHARLDTAEMYEEYERLGKKFINQEVLNELERQSGMLGTHSATVRAKDIAENLATSDLSTKAFSKLIWDRGGHYDKLNQELEGILIDMRTNMDGYEKYWKKLQERMGVKEYEAKRLLINEERREISRQRLELGKETEFEYYMFISEADTNVCPVCAEMHGMVFKTSDAIPGVNFPQVHVLCRCGTQFIHPKKHLNEETGKWEEARPGAKTFVKTYGQL